MRFHLHFNVIRRHPISPGFVGKCGQNVGSESRLRPYVRRPTHSVRPKEAAIARSTCLIWPGVNSPADSSSRF